MGGQEDMSVEEGDVAYQLAEYGSNESVYPFGLDPMWHVTTNELLFFNSFKMKLSVIFGIIQMFFGTCLKGVNAVYFGEKLDLYLEVLPMMVFAASLFIYMVILIFMKWSIDWNERMLSATCFDPAGNEWQGDWTVCDQSGNGYCTPWGYSCTDYDTTVDKCPLDYGGTGDGCQPPNLITSLINIALAPGDVEEPYMMSRQQAAHAPTNEHVEAPNGDEEEDDHGMGEIIIHQAIETIEFVLGMVSNTASYLRLWALSLAHSELATVFWEKAKLSTLNVNWFAAYLGFGAFAGTTLSVLLMMDVLECFLHALRLHWVEFQNKFFKADGVRFSPFSFKQLIVESSSS